MLEGTIDQVGRTEGFAEYERPILEGI